MARNEAGLSVALAEISAPSDDLSLEGLSDLLGFHLKRAQASMHRDFLSALKDFDLTQKQYAVLTLLNANAGASQIALANTLGTDRATMMAIVDRLQNRGFLLRSPSRFDRRRQELYLTKEGMSVLAVARGLVAEHEERFTRQFSAKELEQLTKLLSRLNSAAAED